MKLFYSAASPFVRKVVVLLHELDQVDTVELVHTTTTALASDTDLIAANPLAKLPALTRPDGPTLYDSRVITTYLNNLFSGDFYPRQNARWDVLTLEATGDGIMESAVSMTYEGRLRPPEQQSPDWVEAQWQKVARALDALENRWLANLQGPVGMGQISVACALGYLDLRHDARHWRQGHEILAKWYENFAQRPSMQATQPEG
ncbi:MAG: glutathione S-transferase [Pseudomonadota bacterium]